MDVKFDSILGKLREADGGGSSAVTSVNSKTGAVVLNYSDVGASKAPSYSALTKTESDTLVVSSSGGYGYTTVASTPVTLLVSGLSDGEAAAVRISNAGATVVTFGSEQVITADMTGVYLLTFMALGSGAELLPVTTITE